MAKSENKLALKQTVIKGTYENSAGKNFSSFTGHNYVLSNNPFGWKFYKVDKT